METPIIFDQGETNDIINYDPIKIIQDEIEYKLNIKSKGEIFTFSINVKEQLLYTNYIRTMSFKEIKELNKIFSILNSFNDFYDFLKSLSDKKRLNIKKSNNKISIMIYLEVLLKQEIIEIDLFLGKQDIDLNMKIITNEILNIKENEINYIKKENKKLNLDIIDLKNKNCKLEEEINNIKNKNNTFDAIIKSKIDKNISIIKILIFSIILISSTILLIIFKNLFSLKEEIIEQNKEINKLKNEINREMNDLIIKNKSAKVRIGE